MRRACTGARESNHGQEDREQMTDRIRAVGRFVWQVLQEFVGDDCPRMAAALSYYSVFAMPAMLGLLALAANHFVGPGELRGVISRQITALVGVESAGRVVTIVENAVRPDFGGPAAVVGILALLFGATAAFASLQDALNTAWGVQPDPKRGDVRTFLAKRAVSLAMIGALGVLLVASLLVSAVLSAFQGLFSSLAPAWLRSPVLRVADVGVSFAVLGLLAAVILRWVPDAVVRWRHALVGGLFTGALFTVGKLLIGYYLGRRDLNSVYGAAGSLAMALLWIYYSSMIFLLGAEFTQVWACRTGEPVVPQRGAVRVKRQVIYAEGEDQGAEIGR
jgi:membrane protein